MTELPLIEPKHVAVVGGGVAGLVAALDCARVGIRVTVIDASPRLGGAVARETLTGVAVDTGAESYATRGGHVRALIDSLGLTDAVVRPEGPGAWVHLADGRTAPLPAAGILGVPSVPLATDVVRVIGWRAALRAYLDRLKPVLTIGQAHNLGALVEKRMGKAVLNSLVAPVTRGVYSADPYDLDVTRAAPGLNKAMTTAGSLSGAVASLRESAPAGGAVEGLRGGVHRLVDALEAELRSRSAALLTGAGVVALERGSARADAAGGGDAVGASDLEDGVVDEAPTDYADIDDADVHETAAGWHLTLSDDTTLDADFVIIATPEAQALSLLAPHSDSLSTEDPIEPPAVEIVTLVVDSADLDAKPRGTGVLVAGSKNGAVRAKALTHSTAKWRWLREAVSDGNPHRHIVRLSYGSQGASSATGGRTDAEVRTMAREDAATLLGVGLDDSQIVGFARTPWTGTLAGAALGQRERAERLRETIAGITGADVTGAWLAGTGLASVVPDALDSAARIRRRVVDAYRAAGLDLGALSDTEEDSSRRG